MEKINNKKKGKYEENGAGDSEGHLNILLSLVLPYINHQT